MQPILSFISKSPDPDAALNNFERFLSKTNMKEAYFKVFSSHPYILELLAMLFGSSEFLSNILIKSPELFDGLVATDILNVKKTKPQMIDEFKNAPLTLTLSPLGRGEGEGEKGFLNRLRRCKNGELIRIGIRDILNFADIETTFEELSDLADAVIQLVFESCYNVIFDKRDTNPPSPPLLKGGMGGLNSL